jgi:hypothetical protein
MSDEMVYMGFKGHFLSLQQDGQTLELVEAQETATAFPKDVAEQIVEALKQNGIDEEISFVEAGEMPATPEENA